MDKCFDAIVVGGGINGCSIAYHLARKGKKVKVLERGRLAGEASSAAAGMLGAQAEINEEGPLLEFALRSRAMFPALVEELEGITNTDVGFMNKGMIKIAETEQEAESLRNQVAFHRRWDQHVRWVEQDDLSHYEQEISTAMFGGMYIPNDGQVLAPELTLAFAEGATHYNACLSEYEKVKNILIENNQVKGVRTSTVTYCAEHVIITAGVWVRELLAQTGLLINVYPVKGESLSVIPKRKLLTSTIFSDLGCYIVPKKDGRIIIGATVEENTFNQTVTVGGISHLLRRAQQIIPGLREAEIEKVWAGLRPQTGDGLPYIGEHPQIKGLIVATGHYRNGILLSPITGKLVSDLIDDPQHDEPLLNAFRLNRGKIIV